MDDKKHGRTFWMELFADILKISFTRQILTRQLKTRWFSSDGFTRALIWGEVSSLCYWSRLIVTPQIGNQMFLLQLELLSSLCSWYHQRAHGFVLTLSRTCCLQEGFLLHTLDNFLCWLRLFPLCRYPSPLTRSVTQILFPCLIYVLQLGRWLPSLVGCMRSKPLQLICHCSSWWWR